MPEEIRVTAPLDRLAALLMQAPTPICVTRGPTHRIEIMNAAFEAMAGVRCVRGSPVADLASVFDLAWRGTQARSPGAGGAGLGLAIVRGIAEAHHGQVSVVNAGGGCRFEIRLPALAPGDDDGPRDGNATTAGRVARPAELPIPGL